jgi:hypothetical protein
MWRLLVLNFAFSATLPLLLRNFSFLPRCKWDGQCYRILRSVEWQFRADVSAQPTGPETSVWNNHSAPRKIPQDRQIPASIIITFERSTCYNFFVLAIGNCWTCYLIIIEVFATTLVFWIENFLNSVFKKWVNDYLFSPLGIRFE